MKKFFLYTSLSLLLLFTSCNKFLDEFPDNRQELKTLENLQELLVSAYSEADYFFLEWKTDNAAAIPDNGQEAHLTENFQYKPVVSDEEQGTPTYFWSKTYAAISHANQVLESLEKISTENQALKNAIKGEALVTRAYNHFLLANIFCRHYDAKTASSNLGIPYVTTSEKVLFKKYSRGTLQETYDKIEQDIKAGLPLISNDFYKGSGKYHFNVAAANAFASRFYLYKREYNKCIEYSNNVLGPGRVPPNYVRNMKTVFTGTSSDELGTNFTTVNLPSNLLVVRKESSDALRPWRGYRANTTIFDQVFASPQSYNFPRFDYRYMPYWAGTEARFQPKFNELFRYTTSTTGYPYFIMTELRSEEVMFNRMESYVMTNRLDEALADYNLFAPTRYRLGGQLKLSDVHQIYGASSEQASMLYFVIDERRREFLRESLRWWDIKRFGMQVVHKDVEGNEFVLKPKDLRKAIQIPSGAIEQGIEANPR